MAIVATRKDLLQELPKRILLSKICLPTINSIPRGNLLQIWSRTTHQWHAALESFHD
jgi:hypothetical protein